MTYTWITDPADFDINAALTGTLVGFRQGTGETDYDISKTGTLTRYSNAMYRVIITGIELYCDREGKVINTIPDSEWSPVTTGEGSEAVTTYSQLLMVKAEMGSDGAVGNTSTRTRGPSGTGHTDQVTLSTMEPRDHFAIRVLQTMLRNIDHPEAVNDASMLMYSYAAYKWAQAMVHAAADSREGNSDGSQTGPATVDVETGDLQSNTEKLLFNMSQFLENGVAIKGTDPQYNEPSVKIGGEPGTAVSMNINIYVSIVDDNLLKFDFPDFCAKSDISVRVPMTCKVGTTTGVSRSAGFVIPKGSTVFVGSVDPDITEITSLGTPEIRGKGSSYDGNAYVISLAP